MNAPPGRDRVLAVLDDASVAGALLEASCALAQLMQRELQLVYVESVAALAAAELPLTQVLAQAAHAWSPLAPADVERGWRVQAARLRALAELATARRPVAWSMRVTRGALRDTALALRDESDLLLVASAPARFAASAERPARSAHPLRPLILALDDGGPAGAQAVQVATRLAGAIGARLRVNRLDAAADGLPAARADLLVLPGPALAPAALAALRAPLLLVGQPR